MYGINTKLDAGTVLSQFRSCYYYDDDSDSSDSDVDSTDSSMSESDDSLDEWGGGHSKHGGLLSSKPGEGRFKKNKSGRRHPHSQESHCSGDCNYYSFEDCFKSSDDSNYRGGRRKSRFLRGDMSRY